MRLSEAGGARESFGIYVLCHRGDYRLVSGCLESLRRSAGGVPICLLIDGDLATQQLEAQYGCRVIRRRDVRNERLRNESFGGWGYTKMIPFWEGPFDRFLYLDADTVMIGDVCSIGRTSNADVVIPAIPDFHYNRESISTHWVDAHFIGREQAEFRLLGWPYFVTGVFFGRRGIFDLGQYLLLLALQRREPHRSFRAGEQGILNYLIFSAAQAGRLSYEVAEFQSWPLFMPRDGIRRINEAMRAPAEGASSLATVLHYICVKPSLLQERVDWPLGIAGEQEQSPPPGWPRAMNHFRFLSRRRAGDSRPGAVLRLLAQDCAFHARTLRDRIRGRLARSLPATAPPAQPLPAPAGAVSTA